MPFRHDPADSLADIVEYAGHIREYIAGMDRVAFLSDRKTRDAVERCIERICEAVYRLANRAEDLMPGHPWQEIRGMANRLRHAYDGVDLDYVWDTARGNIPTLAADAARALARLRAEGEGAERADS